MPQKQNRRTNNHFEQNFQQSSANFSQSNLHSSHQNQSSQLQQGEAIQLLEIKPNGKVELNNEALDIIASYNDKPVGFVALVGKYRTGKSFLLNKLLFLDQKGFKVEQYTNACTQGIWMWTNPFINQYLGNYLFFIDTEGLASLQKGQQNDVRIFTLTTLISSYMIYNSVGSIDQRSISDLQAITKLSKNVMTEQSLTMEQNQRRLKDFMPSFCWVVRDFTLQLRDERGRSITPLQYLQNCLRDESALIRTTDESKRIKKSLLQLFKQRDCVTLVRPARQESEIQSLNKLSDVYLRREFVDGVNVLRQKIQRKAGCKMFQGKQLYGNDMACMIQAYAQAINQGKIPSIKSAWQQIVDNQGDMAYAAGHQKYSQLFQNYFSDDQPKEQKQLNRILSRMKQQAIDQFKRNCASQNDEHSRKLRDWIEKQQQTIRQANENAMNTRNLQILKQQSHGLMRKVQQNYYIGKKEEYFADLQDVLRNYRRKAIGDKKQGLLVDFMTATNKIGVNLQKKPQTYENNQYLVKQTQQRMRIQQQANKSKSNQMATAANVAKKEEINKQKRADMKKNKKVQKAGCCGGKCEIM